VINYIAYKVNIERNSILISKKNIKEDLTSNLCQKYFGIDLGYVLLNTEILQYKGILNSNYWDL
jgi:hypothetical protein